MNEKEFRKDVIFMWGMIVGLISAAALTSFHFELSFDETSKKMILTEKD